MSAAWLYRSLTQAARSLASRPPGLRGPFKVSGPEISKFRDEAEWPHGRHCTIPECPHCGGPMPEEER